MDTWSLELSVVKLKKVLVAMLQLCTTLTVKVHIETLNEMLSNYFFFCFLSLLFVCLFLLLSSHELIYLNVWIECIHGLTSVSMCSLDPWFTNLTPKQINIKTFQSAEKHIFAWMCKLIPRAISHLRWQISIMLTVKYWLWYFK